MCSKALQEPAILYLIFSDLSQSDLLRIQRVYRSWRETVTTSKVLLGELFLAPSSGNGTQEQPLKNLLLREKFLQFFSPGTTFWDGYWDNSGPWWWIAQLSWTPDLQRYTKFSYSEASWRRMIPVSSPVDQLQVHVRHGSTGTIARLNFDNDKSWLKFSLIHDIVENAWFRGVPWFLVGAELEFSGAEARGGIKLRDRIPRTALVSDEFRESVCPHPERITLHLVTDDRSQEDRIAAREEQIANHMERSKKMERQIIKPCGNRLKRVIAFHKHVFKDEFHLDDELSFPQIDWDELHTYIVPTDDPPFISPPLEPRRSLLGFLLGCRR